MGVIDAGAVLKDLEETLNTMHYNKKQAWALGDDIMIPAVKAVDNNYDVDDPIVKKGIEQYKSYLSTHSHLSEIAESLKGVYNEPANANERGSDFYVQTRHLIETMNSDSISAFGDLPVDIWFLASVLFLLNDNVWAIDKNYYSNEVFESLRDVLALWLIQNKKVKKTLFGGVKTVDR